MRAYLYTFVLAENPKFGNYRAQLENTLRDRLCSQKKKKKRKIYPGFKSIKV